MHKLKNKLFVILFALGLSSCGSIKKFPDVDFCSAVKEGDKNYAYCVSYYPESNREYEVPADEVFSKKYFMVSPKHYQMIRKYVAYLQAEAEKRCK